jgi:hypothetical protein
LSIIAGNQKEVLERLFHILTHTPPWTGEEILAFRIGEKHCCFAVTDAGGKELYELAYHTAAEVNGNFMNRFFAVYPELNGTFSKVILCYDYSQFVLVPGSYFISENAAAVLHALQGTGRDAPVHTEPVTGSNLYIVYPVKEEVNQGMLSKFPTAICTHRNKNYLKNLPVVNHSGSLRIDFDPEYFFVVLSKQGQLLLVQSFPYSVPDDVIYYLLNICRQFSLPPSEVQLIISGLVDKQSALFHELYQYFMNITFKDADWALNEDNDYPLHFFSSLNEIIQCGS